MSHTNMAYYIHVYGHYAHVVIALSVILINSSAYNRHVLLNNFTWRIHLAFYGIPIKWMGRPFHPDDMLLLSVLIDEPSNHQMLSSGIADWSTLTMNAGLTRFVKVSSDVETRLRYEYPCGDILLLTIVTSFDIWCTSTKLLHTLRKDHFVWICTPIMHASTFTINYLLDSILIFTFVLNNFLGLCQSNIKYLACNSSMHVTSVCM